ncbi:MAG: FAD-dependent oxidoreductase [Clostridium sp.]|nr:FAD-dependent oxidoreductase [Clostridium sp.]
MRYVVLGSSAAGINGINGIRSVDREGEIILISKDEHVYSRCILHHYMEGIRDLKRLCFIEEDFMEKNKVQWIGGKAVTGLDCKAQNVILEDGEKVAYDRLLIATGSHSFFPPITNLREAKGVIGFRNLDDIEYIMEQSKKADHIVVMGAGLVGMDCITGLLESGKDVSVVELSDRMLSIQLDKRAASTYENAYKEHGVHMHFGVGINEVKMNEEGHVVSVVLGNGEEIPCDLLVVTAGVRSNMEFLQDSDVECDMRGVLIDEAGRTNVEGIFAAGDVTGRNPIWPVAVKEGIIAGANMAGGKRVMDDFFASKSTMNFLGIPTMSLGVNTPEDDTYTVDVQEDDKGNYKKVIHKDGIIYGAILQGDISYAGVLTQLIRRKINISKVKKSIFAIDYSDFFHEKENFEFTYEED